MQSNEGVRILEDNGYVQGENLLYQVDVGGGHHEGAWGYRLYDALRFLCGHWKYLDDTPDLSSNTAAMEVVEIDNISAERSLIE